MDKQRIQAVAVRLAAQVGVVNLTRTMVCNEAGIPAGSFTHIMGVGFIEFLDQLRNDGHNLGSGGTRTTPDVRRDVIMRAAVATAEMIGYDKMTRDEIAEMAGCSPSLVSRYLGTMVQLRRDVMRYAVAREHLRIIAQGLIAKDKHALKAGVELRRAASKLIER